MNPSYRTFIDVTLLFPADADNIVLRHIRYLPFVPRANDTIRLTSADEENYLDVVVEGVYFDASTGNFVIDVTDGSIRDRYQETRVVTTNEEMAQYKMFDFVRIV